MKVAILGGGISGLMSGWLLSHLGADFKVFETKPYYGGLARSFDWHGFKCDIAAHRLFTNDQNVFEKLKAAVPVVKHKRRSKIFIGGKWIKDPVSPIELVVRFFPKPGLNFIKDYYFRDYLDGRSSNSFETYILARYGKSLNEFFFKGYTEKLFGIPTDQVSAKWAEQKVRVSGLIDMLKSNTKIYFSHFYYPKEGGYGAFADKFYDHIRNKVFLSTTVRELHTDGKKITAIAYETNKSLVQENFDAVISTIPATRLSDMLSFRFNLHYRPMKVLYLMINQPRVSNNHWIYFAHKDVVVNRLGEFKNFSDSGVPKDKTVVCCEITMDYPEAQLRDRVVEDLDRIGFIPKEEIVDDLLIREDFGYPIYDVNFVGEIRRAMEFFGRFENLYLLGRNAEFIHKEIDDSFGSAINLVKKLSKQLNAVEPIY